jgi:peptidyl-prolyl cis-trans isomerase-like 4
MSIYDDRITRDKYFPVLDLPISPPSTFEIGTVSFLEVENGLVGSKFTISLSNKVHEGQIPFGKVVEGFSVLNAINKAKIDQELRLINDARILQIHILHDPFVQSIEIDLVKKEPYPTEVQLQHVRLESLVPHEHDQSTVQALALELIGDLPHYKIKPSPRVLFVARLNRITTDESLTIIFSRFGTVTNCNIIDTTNTKTKYAFVEFETKEEAESAYSTLNRQPCIIDGNEVIVDFSQSIRKPKN